MTTEAPFTSPFNASSTALEVAEGVDFTGKTVLITGGTLGIGYETARVLALKGAHVIITGRSAGSGESKVQNIIEGTGNTNVEFLVLDLASLRSVRDVAALINERELVIDVLINNAGVFFVPFSLTEDGFEQQFGVNHLGHFLLTGLLIPAFKRSSDSGNSVRVVNVSSAAHQYSKDTTFSDIQFENREYEQASAYGESKLANIYHAVALNSKLQNAGIGSAFSIHPGVVYTEGSSRLEADLAAMGFADEDGNFDKSKTLTPEQGAATTIFAATSPLLNGLGGLYLEESGYFGPHQEGSFRGYLPEAVNPENAESFKKYQYKNKIVIRLLNFVSNDLL